MSPEEKFFSHHQEEYEHMSIVYSKNTIKRENYIKYHNFYKYKIVQEFDFEENLKYWVKTELNSDQILDLQDLQ